jgi:trk system potassium uptake protein TrkA
VLVACTSKTLTTWRCATWPHALPGAPHDRRINNPRHAWLFNEKLHIDVALNESSILAHLIEEEMSLGDMMTLLKLARQYSLVEVVIRQAPGSRRSDQELPIPDNSVIVAIIRDGR